ncbi:hypothetical protein [Spirosoma endbachense]|uniref:Ig-like domain-containing protein n=1 Tax=Spirosoma endbachense TaxID=2666025 RepID=A0A6P1W3B9_9BACT|nr:hypothetical protein [Spirosoma endbachense]QHV98792.1 hypothetical protein GJR95_28985 [Spirosoma endbachense]
MPGSVLSVPFSTTGSFGGSNSFTIQLSDMGGNFTNPVIVGSGSVSPINITIPAHTIPGSGYRMRVVSSDPLAEGTVSPTILTVTVPPSLSASSNSPAGQASVGDTLRLTTTGQNLTGATYQWSGPSLEGPNGYTSTASNPIIPNSTTANNGTYTVTATTPSGCTASAQTSVSLITACRMVYDGDPVANCDSTTADSTHLGLIVVKLLNIPEGSGLHITLYQQTTAIATASSAPASFTGLIDGSYRVEAYAVTGTDTCRAGSRTVTVDCDNRELNIRIKSVDATPTETDLIPRVGGGLGTLNLSVEELDGQDLSGYTYLWTEPTSTSVTTSTAISTTLTAGRIGEYKVTLVKGADTLVAYTTLRAKPCKQVAHTYDCGHPATPVGNLDDTGISNLAPGDTIRTGDFDVIVTEILSGGSSGWTGRGYTQIPYLGDTQIAVDFTNATVNDCYEYTGGGTIQSAFDASWRNVVNVDTALNAFTNIKDLLAVYTAKDKAKLQEYISSLNTVKQIYQSNDGISTEIKQTLIENTNLIEQKLIELATCDSSSNVPGGRKAASICTSPQEIIDLMNQGLPAPVINKQTKTIEFGQFQWELNHNDISNQMHTQANRVEIGQLIDQGAGIRTYWNEYQNYSEARIRDIYENGFIHDRLLGVRDVLSSDSENRIIDNFYTGRQQEVVFGIGDPISNKLVEYYKDSFSHPYISEFINRVSPRIKEGHFDELTGVFVFDNIQPANGIGRPNFSNITEIPFYDFYGIMGGTQKIKVEMELKTITQKGMNLVNSQSYEYTYQKLNATFHIIDWYGADENDINGTSTPKSLSESLKAFFMLQHFWGVGHPFQTRISAKLINELTIK